VTEYVELQLDVEASRSLTDWQLRVQDELGHAVYRSTALRMALVLASGAVDAGVDLAEVHALIVPTSRKKS
jgi:hypothetical protein